MRLKKGISMVFVLAILLTVFSAAALPASAAESAVSVVDTTGVQGTSVAVYVRMTGKIAGVEGDVTYDSSKLTLSSISKTTAINGAFEFNKDRFVLANGSNTTLNNENALKLTFRVNSDASGSAAVSIKNLKVFQAGNNTAYQISHTLQAGSVEIKAPATKITPRQKTMDLTKGTSTTLLYTLTPSTAGDKLAGKVTYSSSDTGVASVNKTTGLIKAKNPGTTTITIKGVKASATCKVTVHNYVSLRVGKTKAISNGVRTTVDNQGTKPFKISGRTMLPLRFVGEKMGGKVNYISDSQPITLTYGNKKVEFRLNSKTMTVYTGSVRSVVTIDVAAQKKKGKTYIPLRAIGQALGFTVHYENGTEIIVVNTPKMSTALRNIRLAEAKSYIK